MEHVEKETRWWWGGGVAKMRLARNDRGDQPVYSERPAEPHKASFWYQLAAVEWKKHH